MQDLSNHGAEPNIWYAGGMIGFTRYFSRFLAILIKVDLAGVSIPIYTDNPQ